MTIIGSTYTCVGLGLCQSCHHASCPHAGGVTAHAGISHSTSLRPETAKHKPVSSQPAVELEPAWSGGMERAGLAPRLGEWPSAGWQR